MKSVCVLLFLQVAVLLLACSDVGLANPLPEDDTNVRDKRDGDGEDQCGDNEVFRSCASSCERTCESISDGHVHFCTQQCVPRCSCKKGYVRDSNKKCIRHQECPRVKH